MKGIAPFCMALGLVSVLTSCRGTSIPLATDLRADKQVYLVGEKIVIEAVVKNLLPTPITYEADRKDLFVCALDETGKVIIRQYFFPQPDGTEDTIASYMLVPSGVCLDMWFQKLSPHGEEVFTKEFVAKRPGRYKATYEIHSSSDVEYLPDPNFGHGSFKGSPPYVPVPWVKERKVPNVWIGNIPEKAVFFEVREK